MSTSLRAVCVSRAVCRWLLLPKNWRGISPSKRDLTKWPGAEGHESHALTLELRPDDPTIPIASLHSQSPGKNDPQTSGFLCPICPCANRTATTTWSKHLHQQRILFPWSLSAHYLQKDSAGFVAIQAIPMHGYTSTFGCRPCPHAQTPTYSDQSKVDQCKWCQQCTNGTWWEVLDSSWTFPAQWCDQQNVHQPPLMDIDNWDQSLARVYRARFSLSIPPHVASPPLSRPADTPHADSPPRAFHR